VRKVFFRVGVGVQVPAAVQCKRKRGLSIGVDSKGKARIPKFKLIYEGKGEGVEEKEGGGVTADFEKDWGSMHANKRSVIHRRTKGVVG